MAEVKSNNRIPPHDIDAEQATLGSIMLNPSAMNEIIDIIQPNTFYAEKHRIIFTVMVDLFSKNEPIDLLSLSSALKDKGQLEQVGGRTYLADLTNSVPASTNVKHYANIVYKKALIEFRLYSFVRFGQSLGIIFFKQGIVMLMI